MKRLALWRAALLAVVALLALPAAALAQCPRTSLADLEDEVMCPVCGTTLATAGSAPQAVRERALIQRLIDDCRSKEEIKTALVAEFGQSALASPPARGFGLAAYLVPLLAIGGGLAAIALALNRWRGGRGGTSAAAPSEPRPGSRPASDEEAERLDADLARFNS